MAKKFIAACVEFSLHADDWVEGESAMPIKRWFETENMDPADSIEELLKQVPHLNAEYYQHPIEEMFENDPTHEGDFSRFDADLCVNYDPNADYEDIIKPTDEQMCKFQKAKIQLYVLHIHVRIEKTDDLNEDDIKQSVFSK